MGWQHWALPLGIYYWYLDRWWGASSTPPETYDSCAQYRWEKVYVIAKDVLGFVRQANVFAQGGWKMHANIWRIEIRPLPINTQYDNF